MNTVNDKILDALEANVVVTEDARGLSCPLPILRTKRALAKLEGGQLLKVLTTDKAAMSDLAVFTKQTGHTLKAQIQNDDVVIHFIEKRI